MSDQAVCPIRYPRNASQPQLKDIPHPHNNDVLSGRGNFVNYHVGNEFFRALVRKHKGAYVACPKAQKAKFSRMIVDEVRNQNPSGRFLKQDPKTELWYDTGDKKALDKTRQALREGAPVLLKELNPSDDEAEDVYIQGDSIGAVMHTPADRNVECRHAYPTVSEPPMICSSMPQHIGIMHASSGRSREAELNVTQATVDAAAATQNLEALQKQLTSNFQAERFTPSPINQSLALQIDEAQAQLEALQQALLQQQQHQPNRVIDRQQIDLRQQQRHELQFELQQKQQDREQEHQLADAALPTKQEQEQQETASTIAQFAPSNGAERGVIKRENSLKFSQLFDTGSKEKETSDVSAMSGMSLSFGNITVSEESDLSAVFEDSVRIADDGKIKNLPRRIGLTGEEKAQDNRYGQSNSNLDNFDMSAMTLGSSTMQTSFTEMNESQELTKCTK